MSELTKPPKQRQDDALAAALKRAADVRGHVTVIPVARVEALGIRRQRRILATAAVCSVCVLGAAGAFAAAQLRPDTRPTTPVITPAPAPGRPATSLSAPASAPASSSVNPPVS